MPKIKTGYSKNILAQGKCKILKSGATDHLIQLITQITRPDGTKYWANGGIHLVNKGEVSNIQEEEV